VATTRELFQFETEWLPATGREYYLGMKYVKAATAAAVAFLLIDLVWIGFFLGDVYDAQLGDMMRETPNGLAAGAFYVAYIAGILYFAVRPAFHEARVGPAALNGALLGALAYGTFTLTNYAIFADWSLVLVLSDIAWGAFLTAISATIGYLVAKP
jgi:uncharacterized membrane protein